MKRVSHGLLLFVAGCAATSSPPPSVATTTLERTSSRPVAQPASVALPSVPPLLARAPAEVAAPPDAAPSEEQHVEAAPAFEPVTPRLPSGLFSPMPGGVMAGYRADTGLDIAGVNLPVYAIASGWIDYAEQGHSRWTGPGDTDWAIRIQLDEPIVFKEALVTHVWYAHLAEVVEEQAEGAERRHVEGGEQLGISGRANGSPHLHLGLLLDGEVEQYWGTYLLEDDVRRVLGDLAHGHRLAELPD